MSNSPLHAVPDKGVIRFIRHGDDRVLLRAPYSDQLVTDIKSLPARWWSPGDKGWVIPLDEALDAADHLRDLGWFCSGDLLDVLRAAGDESLADRLYGVIEEHAPGLSRRARNRLLSAALEAIHNG